MSSRRSRRIQQVDHIPINTFLTTSTTTTKLSPQARTQLDATELKEQIQKHPGQTQDLYLLAESYLKLGQLDMARRPLRS